MQPLKKIKYFFKKLRKNFQKKIDYYNNFYQINFKHQNIID